MNFSLIKASLKSVSATTILASSEGVYLAKEAAACHIELLDINIEIFLVVNSKNLFLTVATQQNSIRWSIRGDFGATYFEFVTDTLKNIS